MMDLIIVEFFQGLGSGFMDVIFGAFYYLLNPLFTMVIPIILYFAIDKRFAYKVGIFYGVTSFFCGTLKELFVRERPLVHTDRVSARIEDKASGYSMPSGHAMGSIGLFYPTVKRFGLKKPFGESQVIRTSVIIASSIAILMIGFSRVYMGGHYLSDVVAGWGFGLIVATALDFAMHQLDDKFYFIGMVTILPLMLLLIILLPESDSCAVGLAFSAAILIGGYLEQKFVKLDINTKAWVRVLRSYIAINGAFIMLFIVSTIFEKTLGYRVDSIKELYPSSLDSSLTEAQIDRATKSMGSIAYFLMFFMANAWAFIACPFLFKYVPRLFKKSNANISEDANETLN